MKLNLSSIILFVQNADRLKAFYVGILKLDIAEESPGWLLLKAGSCNIGLHKMGSQYLDTTKGEFKFDNNTKLVFEIEDNIHTVRQQLLDENIVMREIKTFDNYNYLLCDGEDPEGNVFQLKQKK